MAAARSTSVLLSLLLLCLFFVSSLKAFGLFSHLSKLKTYAGRSLSPVLRSTSTDSEPRITSTFADQGPVVAPSLTQKDYLISVRNRLFAVEEQIWLHEYAIARPGLTNVPVQPLKESKYEELLEVRGLLLEEYPITKLHVDLYDAQRNNLTYASLYLERLIAQFTRQLPLSLEHVNQIAVLSFSGQVINLMRGQGLVYHRLLPSNTLTDLGVKRQFQHPCFSTTGKYLAIAEMHFRDTSDSFLRSDALVFQVPKDAKTYGSTDSMPLFDSGELPGSPFFMRFSPNDETLAILVSSPDKDQQTQLLVLEWGKFFRKDSWAGQASVARFAPRKALTLLTGNPVFFMYTTSDRENATIVAHCTKIPTTDEVSASLDGSGGEATEKSAESDVTSERAVWLLQRQDTGGVRDYGWKKICDSSPTDKWTLPVCHSAGGGDSVLVVEDGWLTTKAISRWKRNPNNPGELASKKLMKVMGSVQFLVSPDGSKVLVLEEDIAIGHYKLTAIEGEDALDPCSDSLGSAYDVPHDKLTMAFWFSPDSTKVLLLTVKDKSPSDVATQKSEFRVGLNSDMQWSVFNFPLRELRDYDVFKPTAYFLKTYVPFFCQFSQVFNPWAPDSRSFIYITGTGLSHTPLVGSKHCLGMGRWQNQGATFGTWSRQ